MTAAQQASLYYARKRARQRAEATAGNGGLRFQRDQVGVLMQVSLKVG